jgi:beta-glucanase (GH16 family)
LPAFVSTTQQVVTIPTPAPSGQPTVAPVPVPLPTGAGVVPVLNMPPAQASGTEQLAATLQNTAPTGIPALNLKRAAGAVRHVAAADSAVSLFFLELYWGSPITFVSQPSFVFTVPSAQIVPGAGYYLALYDPSRPSLGWQYDWEGPAAVSGTTLTFSGNSSPFAFVPDAGYWFAVLAIPNAATAPTPAPSIAPTAVPTQSPPPVTDPGASMQLTFDDEFNGPAGNVDTNWSQAATGNFPDIGGSTINEELQDNVNVTNPTGPEYMPSAAQIDGQGHLILTASAGDPYTTTCKSAAVPCSYTGVRLTTATAFTQAYGYYEIRAQVPPALGISSAFWLTGAQGENVNGEIDAMESIGKAPLTIFGALHAPGFDGEGGPLTINFTPGGGENLQAGFHTYGVLWEPNTITYYLDNVAWATVTPSTIPTGGQWVFTQPLYLILDVSVGGVFAGPPPSPVSGYPTTMIVDYVRVYK